MKATLTDHSNMPPGGYPYREPSIGFDIRAGSKEATLGIKWVAHALMQARINNPSSGLDPSFEACLAAVAEFQCARFQHKPRLLAEFCTGGEVSAAARSVVGSAPAGRRCAGCGRR